jgi:hypothetical protein
VRVFVTSPLSHRFFVKDVPSTCTPLLMGLLGWPSVAQWDGLLCGGMLVPATDVCPVHTPLLMDLPDWLSVAWWGVCSWWDYLSFCHSLSQTFLFSAYYPSWAGLTCCQLLSGVECGSGTVCSFGSCLPSLCSEIPLPTSLFSGMSDHTTARRAFPLRAAHKTC